MLTDLRKKGIHKKILKNIIKLQFSIWKNQYWLAMIVLCEIY